EQDLMADVVLRQGAWPTGHVLCDRSAADAEDGGELRMRDGSDSVGTVGSHLGISHSAQKAREAGHSRRSAAREERRIPDGSQQPQSFAAGNEKAEAAESGFGVAIFDLVETIACGNLRHPCIFDLSK